MDHRRSANCSYKWSNSCVAMEFLFFLRGNTTSQSILLPINFSHAAFRWNFYAAPEKPDSIGGCSVIICPLLLRKYFIFWRRAIELRDVGVWRQIYREITAKSNFGNTPRSCFRWRVWVIGKFRSLGHTWKNFNFDLNLFCARLDIII